MRTFVVMLLALGLLAPHAECKSAAASKGGTAFLQSLLVPGWGQYAQGSKRMALVFLGSELAMLGGIYSMKAFSNSSIDDYTAMARAYAGVSGDHSHEFFVDIGNWMNTDLFNEQRLRDRQYDALYRNEADQWEWDTDAHREEFKKVRIRADRVKNDVIYLVGGLALNHVVSAIHAGRLGSVKAQAEQSSRGEGLRLGAAPLRGGGVAVRASLSWR